MLGATIDGLRSAGHDVELLDLYQLGFEPCLSESEHRHYETISQSHPDPMIVAHMHSLQTAAALVFVYPTWWGGMPAILKGWLERTLLPGVGFVLDPQTRKLKPGLPNIRRIVGISTYGANRRNTFIIGDGGRRTITRGLRAHCHRFLRSTWLGLYEIDSTTPEDRAAFLRDVTTKMAGLR